MTVLFPAGGSDPWDVESGTLASKFDMDVPAANTISTDQAHSGTKSIKFSSASGSGVTGLTADLGSGHSQIYARWWWWFSSTTNSTAAGRHGFRFTQRSGDQWFNHHEFDTEPNGGNWGFVILDHDAGEYFEDHTSLLTFPEDQWFKFEIFIKLGSSGTADGTVKILINDNIEYNNTAIQVRGPGSTWTQIDTFALNTNWDSGTALWYCDDIYVSDTDESGSDTTPPTLSSPDDGTPTSSGTTNASVSTDEGNGTLYYAAVTDGGSCTDAQLKAGSGGNIVAASAGSQSVSGTGTQTFSLSGLSASTNYEIQMLHRDAAGNDSSQATVSLTTTAASQQSVLLLDDFEVDSIAAPPTGNYYEIDTSGLTRSQVEAVSGTWSLRHANMSQSASLWAGFGKLPANTSWPAFAQAPGCSTTAIYRDITVQFKHKFTGWTSGGSAPDGWKLLRISCFAGETGAQAAVLHLWNSDTNVVRLMFDPATGVSGSTLLTTEWNDFANLTFLGGQKMLTDFYVAGNLDTWFDFKVRMKLNDPGQSNGVMQLWIDDVEITEMTATNLNYIGSYATFGINTVHLERYANSGGSATDVSYFDDLTIIDNEAQGGGEPGVGNTPPSARRMIGLVPMGGR